MSWCELLLYTTNISVQTAIYSDGKTRSRYLIGGKTVSEGTYNYIIRNGVY